MVYLLKLISLTSSYYLGWSNKWTRFWENKVWSCPPLFYSVRACIFTTVNNGSVSACFMGPIYQCVNLHIQCATQYGACFCVQNAARQIVPFQGSAILLCLRQQDLSSNKWHCYCLLSKLLNLQSVACIAFDVVIGTRYSTVNVVNYLRILDVVLGQVNCWMDKWNLMNFEPCSGTRYSHQCIGLVSLTLCLGVNFSGSVVPTFDLQSLASQTTLKRKDNDDDSDTESDSGVCQPCPLL